MTVKSLVLSKNLTSHKLCQPKIFLCRSLDNCREAILKTASLFSSVNMFAEWYLVRLNPECLLECLVLIHVKIFIHLHQLSFLIVYGKKRDPLEMRFSCILTLKD